MIETTKVFQYRILEELPIDHLADFKHHHRLTVFYHKGTTCVQCNKTGTRLIKGEGRGRHHWVIYTDDLYPLTVDHIIPKSLGGGEELNNKQPMCAGCNFKKGNGENGDWVPTGFYKCSLLEDLNLLIGKPVWKRTPKLNSNRKHKKLYHFGTCSGVTINPLTKKIAAIVLGKPGVLFDLKTLFVSQDDYQTGTDTHFFPMIEGNRQLSMENTLRKILIGQRGNLEEYKKPTTIGFKVRKKKKPFKSGLMINTVKDVINHPILNIPAYTFYEDDSFVECWRCIEVSPEEVSTY